MLYAKINQAYIDDEETAKKIVFERTIKWVNKLYPEGTEVSLIPDKLSPQLQYGYDSLFETWKSAIEQLLSATYHDDKVAMKSYEIIRKYNSLSSYLKNIMSMNKLSSEDEQKIKTDFDKMKDKLNALKTLANQNNFLDKQDINDMVEKVNSATVAPKAEYEKVSTKTEDMTDVITSKLSAQDEYKKMFDQHANMVNVLNAPTAEQIVQMRYNPTLQADLTQIDTFIGHQGQPDTLKYTEEKTRDAIHDLYKTFHDSQTILKDKHTVTEIIKSIDKVKRTYKDIEDVGIDIQKDLTQLDNTYIVNAVDAYINVEQPKEDTQLKNDLAIINAMIPIAPLRIH